MKTTERGASSNTLLETILRRSDLALAALVVATVGLMVVPLPTWLLDLLLSLNLGLAVILLASSLYVAGVAAVTTLPSILLLATLFRLALNVSSTRLILTQADAGAVIESFGSFVVSGNAVVGAVIFLILTVIQFVVIAKGAERIAEVGARFSLDAMPGRQLAIDADLRAGIVAAQEAGARRRELQRESQLYGAMDGAMKFVKGDAIAGLVITAINIVGGLTIGVWQHGMSLSDAAHTYTLLTVGDGLVSQIPALIIAMSAGIVVTRVAGEDSSHLGGDIARQILARPRALTVAAALFVGLAAIPGLPLVPFLAMAALAGAAAALAWRRERKVHESAQELDPARSLEVHIPADSETTYREGIERARAGVEADWGVPLARPRYDRGPECAITIRHVPVPLELQAPSDATAVEAAARSVLESHLPDLLGLQEVGELLERERRARPAPVEAALEALSLSQIRSVLVNLLDGGVPIHSLQTILESLAEVADPNDETASIERCRRALRRQISHRFAPDGVLRSINVEREIEDMLEAQTRKHSKLDVVLPPGLHKEFEDAARSALGERATDLVVLTRPAVRPALASALRRALDGRRVTTLSFDELEPQVRVEPAGMIRATEAVMTLPPDHELRELGTVFGAVPLPNSLAGGSLAVVGIGPDPLVDRHFAAMWLTDAELLVPSGWRSDKRRRHWFAGRIAAKKAAAAAGSEFDPVATAVTYAATGAPLVVTAGKRVRVALTHSGRWAMAAAIPDGVRLGIDYETGAHDKLHLVPTVSCAAEVSSNKLDDPDRHGAGSRFAQLWTLKEACLKAFEVGIVGDLHSLLIAEVNEAGVARVESRYSAAGRPHPLPADLWAAVVDFDGHPLALVACGEP